MDEVVDAVDDALREKGQGRVVAPPKLSLHGEAGAFSQVMAAALPGLGALGVKWVSIVPANAAAGLPTVNGLIVANDPADGLPEAIMDASLVTAWRTGASAGVAARYLARAGADCIGVRRLRRAGARRRRRAGRGPAGTARRALLRRRPAGRGALRGRPPGTAPWARVHRLRGGGRRPQGLRRRGDGDHDARRRGARARRGAAGGGRARRGARLRRRVERRRHGRVRAVLLRRHRPGPGHQGGRPAPRGASPRPSPATSASSPPASLRGGGTTPSVSSA